MLVQRHLDRDQQLTIVKGLESEAIRLGGLGALRAGGEQYAVDALARMHAHWWGSPALDDMDWLPVPHAPQYVAAVPNIYRAGLPVLEMDWADRVPPAAIDVGNANTHPSVLLDAGERRIPLLNPKRFGIRDSDWQAIEVKNNCGGDNRPRPRTAAGLVYTGDRAGRQRELPVL